MACFLQNFAYTHFLLFCNHIIISFCFLVVDNPTNPCGHLSCPPNSRCIVGTNGTAKCACAKNSCPQLNELVCGSNGKTYRNTCEMENDSCDNNETITVAHKGHCRSKWSQMAISIHMCYCPPSLVSSFGLPTLPLFFQFLRKWQLFKEVPE